MRSVELLMNLFPDKTGAEILAIQSEDKKKDEAKFKKENERMIKYINDINTNGGFFKGRFGLDQRYFYNVYDLKMDTNGTVRMKAEKIIVFLGCKGSAITEGGVKIEKSIETYEDLSQYGLESCERIDKKEWDELNSYLYGIDKFWSK